MQLDIYSILTGKYILFLKKMCVIEKYVRHKSALFNSRNLIYYSKLFCATLKLPKQSLFLRGNPTDLDLLSILGLP